MIYDIYKVCLASLPACQGNWLPQSPPAIWGTSSILASNSEATQQAYTASHDRKAGCGARPPWLKRHLKQTQEQRANECALTSGVGLVLDNRALSILNPALCSHTTHNAYKHYGTSYSRLLSVCVYCMSLSNKP